MKQNSPCLAYSFYSFNSITFFLLFSTFLILQTIPFHFFSIIFSTFQIPIQYIKSQPFIPPRNSQSENILHHYSKSFSNHSKLFSNYFFHLKKWNGMEWPKWPPKQRVSDINLANKPAMYMHVLKYNQIRKRNSSLYLFKAATVEES